MTETRKGSLRLLLLIAIVAYFAGSAFFSYSFNQSFNNRNVSVDTRVYINNSLPEVVYVSIEGGATNITLAAGSYKNVTCNATVRDYNGGSTITNVTAVFFHNVTPTNWSTPDDNNTHYTNLGCTLESFDTYTRNVSCSFSVQYHANAGFWICNVTATDEYLFNGSVSRQGSNSNRTFIDGLLALNVTVLIDYGNMSVGDTSSPQEANITNIGNQNINVSVKGYARTINDGLAMMCEIGNISVQYEKYNIIGGTDITTYRNLSATHTQIANLTILQQTNDSQRVVNSTYWMLYVPPNPFGLCNGTVIFQAERS
jgi:hypothetical protein